MEELAHCRHSKQRPDSMNSCVGCRLSTPETGRPAQSRAEQVQGILPGAQVPLPSQEWRWLSWSFSGAPVPWSESVEGMVVSVLAQGNLTHARGI